MVLGDETNLAASSSSSSSEVRISAFPDEISFLHIDQKRSSENNFNPFLIYPSFLKTTSTCLFTLNYHICPVFYLLFMYSISHSCLVAIPTKSVEPFVCLPLVYSSGVLIKLKWRMQICFTKFNQIQMRKLKLGQRAHWALMPGSICLKTWKVVKTLFPVFIYKLVSHLWKHGQLNSAAVTSNCECMQQACKATEDFW